MRPRPRGLGRLEFAACCAVLGVLMAMLLGRLATWPADARQLRLEMAIAAVNRAVSLFQAQCMRTPRHHCDALPIDGQTIAGAHGHLAASPDGIARLAGLSPDTRLHATTLGGVPALTIELVAAGAPPCQFTYVQASHAGAMPGIPPDRISCP